MKSFKMFIMAVVATPFLALSANASVCYQATSAVPALVPKVICLTTVLESNTPGKLIVNGEEAEISVFSRKNEDKYSFTAEQVFIDESSSICGSATKATLVLQGQSVRGEIQVSKVSASIKVTNDSCHYDPMPEVIEYAVIK
jgi:hypothetical protein